jgi:hypothetical protein
VQILYDSLISAAGTKIKALYIFAQDGSEGAGWVNLMDPETYTITEGGNIAWTNDEGITTSTSSANYYNTTFNPTTAGMSSSSASLGFYVGAHPVNEQYYYGGSVSFAPDLYLGIYHTPEKSYLYYSNNRYTQQSSSINAGGHPSAHSYILNINGTAATDTKIFYNGGAPKSPSFGATAAVNSELWIGFVNNTIGQIGSNEMALAFIGEGLTDQEAADVHQALADYVATTNF